MILPALTPRTDLGSSSERERILTRGSEQTVESGAGRLEQIEDIELRLLLDGIYALYGYDFRDYALSSLRRRVHEARIDLGEETVSSLQSRVLRDPASWRYLFSKLSVHVTSFYRNPEFFRALRQHVIPELRKLPYVRIWHAGCATGEEVYSTAIVLHEEGILDRCRIYATDMNDVVLRQAKNGIYATRTLDMGSIAYRAAGGERDFSEYFVARYDHGMMHRSLRQNILFSQHNLVTDGSFNEFHLILARNVLIYFNKTLQDKVNLLFNESLAQEGFLGLGERESLRYTPIEDEFTPLHRAGSVRTGLYRKSSKNAPHHASV